MASNAALKTAIFESGRTQIAVATDAGIHETRLSKIIRGHVLPTRDEQAALAEVLGAPRAALFPVHEAVA